MNCPYCNKPAAVIGQHVCVWRTCKRCGEKFNRADACYLCGLNALPNPRDRPEWRITNPRTRAERAQRSSMRLSLDELDSVERVSDVTFTAGTVRWTTSPRIVDPRIEADSIVGPRIVDPRIDPPESHGGAQARGDDLPCGNEFCMLCNQSPVSAHDEMACGDVDCEICDPIDIDDEPPDDYDDYDPCNCTDCQRDRAELV